jgi:hypothetical protein
MNVPSILAPVFVQVLLTFALLFWMGRSRFAALRGKEVRVGEIALGERNWPPRVLQIANAYHNQFELPVLFYAAVAFALITRQAGFVFVILSWLYVATRFVHAYIYTTSNVLVWRFRIFLVGALILMAMWILLAVQILLPGS